MRYFIYFAYNGTNYNGWQIQPNGIAVQEVFTNALQTFLRESVDVIAAGRTDSGVHAKQMVAHFDTTRDDLQSDEVVRRLNSILPRDIAVDKIIKVQPNAHARFDAISRTYEYHVYQGKNVFKENLAVRLFNPLDFDLMNIAASKLLDYTDFTSFSKLHTDVKTNNCIVKYAKWEQQNDEWVFTIEADRFLRNMVRSIVGTLFDVGAQKISVDDFCKIIEAKDRCKAGVSVPAHGLYLVKVEYPAEIFLMAH
ncbi:MAG: tRNA pseudouridine(38-40) synthase TruA [Bacteroidales bacterium 36-12]|nr:MAG: tRNA pseudouridine(38-40) synthase TruA [Bacteroidales bacterium 36-12]